MQVFKCHGLLITLAIMFCATISFGQDEQSVEAYQKELNDFFMDPQESPLKEKAKEFKGHDFFAIDNKFRVKAKFTRALNALPFHMKTTTNRLPIYEKYGEASFFIDGQELSLTLYKRHPTQTKEEFTDHLFLPFTDVTNGEETYQGGRYIDIRIPDGDTLNIDFNKAYNPYCAYNADYSCVIPPKENHLNLRIAAGVKYGKSNK